MNSTAIVKSEQSEPVIGYIKIGPSVCETFRVVSQNFKVPSSASPGGFIPVERRSGLRVFGNPLAARAAVLLVPGFLSNRGVFKVGGGTGTFPYYI